MSYILEIIRIFICVSMLYWCPCTSVLNKYICFLLSCFQPTRDYTFYSIQNQILNVSVSNKEIELKMSRKTSPSREFNPVEFLYLLNILHIRSDHVQILKHQV